MTALAEISIQKALPEHLAGIVEIEQKIVSPWTRGQIEEEMALAHGWQFVAIHLSTSKILGYIFGSLCTDESEIRKLAVSSCARKNGIGKALLTHALHYLQKNHIRSCFLELRESNAPALALYASFNFKQIGLRKSYYINPCEHAIILRKHCADKEISCEEY